MLKWENGCIVDLTQEEENAIKVAIEEHKKQELKRPLEPHEVFNLLAKNLVNKIALDDETSLRMKKYYPEFNDIIGKEVDTEFKFTYEDELWKVRQKHTPQEIYTPSIDTASLYERIDEKHAGTIDDPIPYDQTMQVFKGIYYVYKDVIYKCIRDSGLPLYAPPDSLIGNYFEVAEKREGE